MEAVYLEDQYLEKLYKSYGMHSMEDLYAAICDGSFLVKNVLNKLNSKRKICRNTESKLII